MFIINREINVTDWVDVSRLSLNISKTNETIFQNKGKQITFDLDVCVSNESVNRSETAFIVVLLLILLYRGQSM